MYSRARRILVVSNGTDMDKYNRIQTTILKVDGVASAVRNGTFQGNFIPRVVKRIIVSKKRKKLS